MSDGGRTAARSGRGAQNGPGPWPRPRLPDAVLEGEGVQDQAKREYCAQNQAEQLGNPTLAHSTLQHPKISRASGRFGSSPHRKGAVQAGQLRSPDAQAIFGTGPDPARGTATPQAGLSPGAETGAPCPSLRA